MIIYKVHTNTDSFGYPMHSYCSTHREAKRVASKHNKELKKYEKEKSKFLKKKENLGAPDYYFDETYEYENEYRPISTAYIEKVVLRGDKISVVDYLNKEAETAG